MGSVQPKTAAFSHVTKNRRIAVVAGAGAANEATKAVEASQEAPGDTEHEKPDSGIVGRMADAGMKDIHSKVVADSIEQYEIAKESGSDMDACVQAGMVAAAALQAKDREEYKKWKGIESEDCEAAGMPK